MLSLTQHIENIIISTGHQLTTLLRTYFTLFPPHKTLVTQCVSYRTCQLKPAPCRCSTAACARSYFLGAAQFWRDRKGSQEAVAWDALSRKLWEPGPRGAEDGGDRRPADVRDPRESRLIWVEGKWGERRRSRHLGFLSLTGFPQWR